MMYRRMINIILGTSAMTLLLFGNSILAQDIDEIIVWNRLLDNPAAYKILQRALENSREEFGDYQLTMSSPMEQGRVERELMKNKRVHVANFAPSVERETRLLPIRMPVTKGMLGMRVCLIKKGSQAKFDAISSKEQWQQAGLTIGQGTHWPDTPILKHNGLSVVTSNNYHSLFAMLDKQRFDCFSRSITEVLAEQEMHDKNGFEIEHHLLLVYPLPTFFFVSRDNPKLAARIEKGLTAAVDNGSLNDLIKTDYADTFKRLKIDSRQIIYLDNPFLSKQTQALIRQRKFWLTPTVDAK